MHNLDINLDHITKVEGAAALEVRVRKNKVEHAHFKITEYKRFYTEAMKGKPIWGLPQLLSRICGTCSNAHILCSIEACERALGIEPSAHTMLLRILTMYGLMIRDHALHLYLFVLPDLYGKDSFLDFDEKNPEEHQLLRDGFDIKAAGNFLATLVAGRSIHAPYPIIGGFTHFPDKKEIRKAIGKLQEIRPAAERIIRVFEKASWHFDRQTNFVAMVPERFGFLNGWIDMGNGDCISEQYFRDHLERVVLPYSQASAYKHESESYMVGSLARLNLAKNRLHPKTKKSLGGILNIFPSTNIYHNNLAQAIEILHSIDDAIEILENNEFKKEPIINKAPQVEAVGVGVIEAPRGTLYHKVEIDSKGVVKNGEVVVPTGQNQINIEKDIARLVEELVPEAPKEKIEFEIEKLIRAYDPCMSCAAHFLKVKWG